MCIMAQVFVIYEKYYKHRKDMPSGGKFAWIE